MRRTRSRSPSFSLRPSIRNPRRRPIRPTGKPQPVAGPTFLQALRDRLGLKLESVKAPLRVLVIDHVEKPSEN